jgi:hypothetical protein
MVFLAPGLLARAGTNQGGAQSSLFQGFIYQWDRKQQTGHPNGGFSSPGSLQNMQSEARDFHMNTVVIPIYADMPDASGPILYWHTTDKFSLLDILPDTDYERAVNDARKAGLQPIFELEVNQYDPTRLPDKRPLYIGEDWYGLKSNATVAYNGGTQSVASLERPWVDNYTTFAVHFATLAQQMGVNYLIIGDGLANVTSDSSASSASNDPAAKVVPPGDTFNASACTGRHECEWRHIIHAIRGLTYSTYVGSKPFVGAHYTGKLIYAASWNYPDDAGSGPGEFEAIQWWDAVDAIGVNAFFPLTTSSDLQVNDLEAAWHGKGSGLSGQGDIYTRLQAVSDKFHKEIMFTAAGYQSVPAANMNPPRQPGNSVDQNEQLTDIQALLYTFQSTPWWLGTFWYYDQPLAPRSAQLDWAKGPQWAGDNLHGSKPTDSKKVGPWLSSFYQPMSVPCLC